MRDNLHVEVVFGVSYARYDGGDDHSDQQEPRNRRMLEPRRKHIGECSVIFGLCSVYVVVAFLGLNAFAVLELWHGLQLSCRHHLLVTGTSGHFIIPTAKLHEIKAV